MNISRSFAFAAALAVGAFAQAGLLDVKMERTIDMANESLLNGNFAKAEAYADLILLNKPLRVKVDYSNVPSHRRFECRAAVEGAIDIWSEGLGETLNVELVESGRSDVRIRWQPTVYYSGQVVAGRAMWSRKVHDWGFDQYTSQIKGDISLSLEHPEGRSMTRQEMRHTAAHEFGHILGMWDSPKPGDIMGPLTGADELGDAERQTILYARGQAQMIAFYAQTGLRAMTSTR